MRKEITIPECAFCKHYISIKKSKKGRSYCVAFPEGVPPEIMHSWGKHKTPVKGQLGKIVFECTDEPEAKRLHEEISS
ncbi:MAG: hypothetical protein ACOYEG_07945 [Petrimonas sp.]|jgi:hypothetical protein